MCFVFLVQPNIISEIQNKIETGSVTAKWEVGEKICGYSAVKFRIRIETKISIINLSLPFSFLLRAKLTSFLNMETIFFRNFVVGEDPFHIYKGVTVTEATKINQAEEKIEELGSKIENKFVIIIFFFLFCLNRFYF